MRTHKHERVLTSKGDLRSHPIARKHGERDVIDEHNKSLGRGDTKFWQGAKLSITTTNKTSKKKETPKLRDNQVLCGIDKDGYINIDLRKADCSGIRVIFERTESRVKRKVGLQIDKN